MNDNDDRIGEQLLYDLARDLIAAGFAVFPAAVWVQDDGTVGKAPLTPHGHLDAHTDLQLIIKQLGAPPHCPPGVPKEHEVVVAFLPGSGNCGVLDCDVKHGKAGKAALAGLANQYGREWIKAAWLTPSGGLNILFRKPAGVTYSNRSPWAGIDVRADNGWVVAPGNICQAGAWTWRPGSDLSSAVDLPGAMSDLLTAGDTHRPKATRSEAVQFIEASPTVSSAAALAKFNDQLNEFGRSGRGSRHDAMVKVLGYAFGLTSLDLRHAVEAVKVTWQNLTAGEGREDEVTEVVTWVVAQERTKRASKASAGTPGASTAAAGDPAGDTLPDEFWQRPDLALIRSWAHSRMRSADAVYAAVRARLCTLIPHTLGVDTGIAVPISLNSLTAVIGRSGAGKSTATALGREAVPFIPRTDIYEGPLGSGEGIIEAYYDWVEQSVNGKTVKTKVQVKVAALLLLDEGEALSRMATRSGTTILPTLRSAYSGEMIGQTNASKETRRVLPARTYRFVLLVGLQDPSAAALLADVDTGTPQRFVMFNANDPSIPEQSSPVATPWGGKGPWVPPTVTMGQAMTLEPTVLAEVHQRALGVQRGTLKLDPLDSHRDQNRIVEAAMLALMDRRLSVNDDDWRLAGMIVDTSDRIRTWVQAMSEARGALVAAAQTNTAVNRQRATAAAVAVDAHARSVTNGAKAIARKVKRSAPDPVGRGDLSRSVAGRDKAEASFDEMVEHAEQQQWVRFTGEGWMPGPSTPS